MSGNIFLEDDFIVKNETKILEGTTFIMSEGVSIIFENKVNAIALMKNLLYLKKYDAIKWEKVSL